MAPISVTAAVPNLPDTFSLARQGVDAGLRAFDAAAQAVAADGVRSRVAAGNAVAAIEARNEVSFAARLFRAADQMLGTILDIRA